MQVADLLKARLDERRESDSCRILTPQSSTLIDFYSNDYLGLARTPLDEEKAGASGSTGSRLLSGNVDEGIKAELFLAKFHHTESATIFGSGYDANLGLLSALAQRGTTIVYDELCHASIIDGLRLGVGTSWKFEHNNLQDLEEKLSRAHGVKIVVTESVFSMDGDRAPLAQIVELAKRYVTAIIVDEAHSTGVFGKKGEGLVEELGLEKEIFARVHTFGKALGYHGACVVGDSLLKEYLINFARSFIYTTALTPQSYNGIVASYERVIKADQERKALRNIINVWKEVFSCGNDSPIQTIRCSSATDAKKLARCAQENGFDIRAILSPTVARGEERLRVCLHAINTETQIIALKKVLSGGLKGLSSPN